MDSSSSALRPLTLRSLPPQLAEISSLKARLAQSQSALERYAQLQEKLATFADEPVWNAWIPFGPLAYLPGQLVHTNDVLVPQGSTSEEVPESGTGARPEPTSSLLRSAKQARQGAQSLAKPLEKEVAALKLEIAQKEEQLSQQRRQENGQATGARGGKGKAPLDLDLVSGELGQEDWTINERGEVINEEGLPMFDIHEDLPPDDPVSASSSRDGDKSEGGSGTGQAPPKRRYLIKKGGKQTIGTLNPKTAPPPPVSGPASSARAHTQAVSPNQSAAAADKHDAEQKSGGGKGGEGQGEEDEDEEDEDEEDAHGANPIPDRPRLDIKAILDELEAEERLQLQKEEEEEEEKQEEKEEEEAAATVPSLSTTTEGGRPALATAAGQPSSSSSSSSSSAPPPPAAAASTSAPPTGLGTGFAGFAPGFLTKSSKQKRPSNSLTTTAVPTTNATTTPTPTAVPASSSSVSASASSLPKEDKSASPPPTTTKGKVPATAATAAAAPAPLKPALSRPVSPSRAAAGRGSGASTPVEKKRVAFDLPPPSSSSSSTAASSAPKNRTPIILGMGEATPEFEETISSDEFKKASSLSSQGSAAVVEKEKGKGKGPVDDAEEKEGAKPKPKPKPELPFQRPIRDTVVEKPLRKPVPPSPATGSLSSSSAAAATAGAPMREKRVSRFKRMKEDAALGDVERDNDGGAANSSAPSPPSVSKRPQPEWGGPPEVVPTASKPTDAPSRNVADSEGAAAKKPTVPAPVHTISFGAPKAEQPVPEGTVSYADIPDDSNDEEDDEEPYHDDDDSDEDEFVYSDEDEDDIDDAELDVDAALHAREVALAYHQQRLNLGGGRGTGALGGYHEVGQSPFGNVGRDHAAIVPADATLQSLDPEIATNAFGSYSHAGSAQLGKGSRFRNATRHLESAQLIIPSLLAADPTFTTSKEALGPASTGPIDHQVGEDDDDGLDETERERLRKTLEAIAEGRPLPEDQQQYERQREIFLREELAQEKEERERERRVRERTAGKRPPELVQRIPPPVAAPKAPATAPSVAPVSNSVVEKAPSTLLASDKARSDAATAPDAAVTEAEPPKRMSRFRQKQLGLID
ncbi:hypothetical protein JCM8115_003440 [Rhodotorula mucilaginosa]